MAESAVMEGAYGVFARQDLLKAFECGVLQSARALDDDQVQPCSVDLRLGDHATCVTAGFVPNLQREPVEKTVERKRVYDFPLSTDHANILRKGETYIIPLEEKTSLLEGTTGAINPKSTTGRGDSLTNVFASGVSKLDTILPGENRQLYIKIRPLSFDLLVKRGTRLSQLRVDAGQSLVSEPILRMEYHKTPLLYDPEGKPIPMEQVKFRNGGIDLHVDLEADIVAYRARKNSDIQLDLTLPRGALQDRLKEFWEPMERPKNGEFTLEKDEFYLLATYEKTLFPPHLCGELLAYDITSFEGRAHYAGYADAGFFASITSESRVHNEPFTMYHRQALACMLYRFMRTKPIDNAGKVVAYEGNYQNQPRGPNLGKQFLAAKVV